MEVSHVRELIMWSISADGYIGLIPRPPEQDQDGNVMVMNKLYMFIILACHQIC